MVRVGLAGLGSMGGMHAQCLAALPSAKVVAVCDPEADRREKFAGMYGAMPYASLDDMLKAGIDMVDLCLPTYLHREAVVAAAGAKKHILCEKPMAMNGAECDAMMAAVAKAGVQFMVAHVLRFWPEYVAIKGMVDSGALGKVKWVSAARLSAPPVWAWRKWLFDPKLSGGAALDLHIHDLDMIAWLLGKPKVVEAAGIKSKTGSLDAIFTTMTGAPGGAVGFAEGSLEMAAGFPFTMGLRVNLEGGSIEFNSRGTPSLMVGHADGSVSHPEATQPEAPAGPGGGTQGNISAAGGYFAEMEYFVNCLEKGEKPTRVTAEEAKLAVELCLAAAKSAETGKAVAV